MKTFCFILGSHATTYYASYPRLSQAPLYSNLTTRTFTNDIMGYPPTVLSTVSP